MKASVGRTLLIAFTVFSLFLIFHLSLSKKSVSQSITQNQIVITTSPGAPRRLIIPVININAGIQYVGVNSEGEMEVPNNTVDVAWFKLGIRPGERGSAVISGHINGENGEAGVFTDLNKLKKGDRLYIEDDKGTTNSFIVRESRIYDPGYAEEVFSSSDKAHLNLVTCNGVWDSVEKSYSKRLVVFTDITD